MKHLKAIEKIILFIDQQGTILTESEQRYLDNVITGSVLDNWDKIELEFKEWDADKKFGSSQREILDFFKNKICK
jgi:hypothetical protein